MNSDKCIKYWELVEKQGDDNNLCLRRFLEDLDQEDSAGEFINNTCKQGINGLQRACVIGDYELASLLLEFGASTEGSARDSYSAIHHCCTSGFEDILMLLLNNNADIESITSDKDYYVSGTALYLSGGQTPLHLAAYNDNIECVTALLSWIKNSNSLQENFIDGYINTPDCDGNIAFDLAVISKAFKVAETLQPEVALRLERCRIDNWPPSEEWIIAQRAKTSKIQQERIIQGKKQKETEELKYIRDHYSPLCSQLTDDSISETEIINLLLSDNIAKLFKDPNAKFSDLQWTEPTPGVFLVPNFFSKKGVEILKAECENFLAANLPLVRPNISVPYGFKLDRTGLFNNWLKHLQKGVIEKLGKLFFPDLPVLQSSETFVKHYFYGKDTKPSTHYDPSVLTFSICLGEEFSGSEVYFHGVQPEDDSCGCSKRTPHPERCPQCKFVLSQEVGQAVFHVGHHIHGVFPLTSGERMQMIMWLYSY